jgi:hypothetical protein
MKHFKQDLAQVELQRRAKRGPDSEAAVFHPASNLRDPLRRSAVEAKRFVLCDFSGRNIE